MPINFPMQNFRNEAEHSGTQVPTFRRRVAVQIYKEKLSNTTTNFTCAQSLCAEHLCVLDKCEQSLQLHRSEADTDTM